MKQYKVRVERKDIQFWEVEAMSEKEAMDNYTDGNIYQTNTHKDTVEVVGEINLNKLEPFTD
jgi:hypothetical protein|tara:strand:- start:940 stop:1125 length:186 start_codon:yes stop_codon:yes gene_type:complete